MMNRQQQDVPPTLFTKYSTSSRKVVVLVPFYKGGIQQQLLLTLLVMCCCCCCCWHFVLSFNTYSTILTRISRVPFWNVSSRTTTTMSKSSKVLMNSNFPPSTKWDNNNRIKTTLYMSRKEDDDDDNEEMNDDINNMFTPKSNIVTMFDRFQAICPASIETIRLFDPTLVSDDTNNNNNNNNDAIWVAVYRSNNNQPGVYLRDELFQSMMTSVTNAILPTTVPTTSTSTTTTKTNSNSFEFQDNDTTTSTSSTENKFETTFGLKALKPVAVARLLRRQRHQRRSSSTDDVSSSQYYYLLDSMRCILKKETLDPSCDGGSEHTEAIATAIDTLLRYYLTTRTTTQQHKDSKESTSTSRSTLTTTPIIEGSIRTKATLVSAPLLLQRGFVEIQYLCPDMATHVSSYDKCFEFYAHRSSIITTTTCPSIRQRSIDIVSLLGTIDRTTELLLSNSNNANSNNNENDDTDTTRPTINDDDDPWINMRKFI